MEGKAVEQNSLEHLEQNINQNQTLSGAQRAEWFQKLGPASLLYAILYTACMYNNLGSVMTPIWTAGTVFYVLFVLKQIEVPLKKGNIIYIFTMTAVGVSSFLTGNVMIQVFNQAVFFVLLVLFLLHNFYEDRNWGIGNAIVEFLYALFGAVATIPAPYEEGMDYFQSWKHKKGVKCFHSMLGVVFAIPFLFIVGAFLANADAVFGKLFWRMTGVMNAGPDVILVSIMAGFGFFSSYCGMRYFAKRKQLITAKEGKRFDPSAAIVFSSVLTAMYLVFCGIQVYYLFLGYGELPNDMTYAEYARTGFFQLLFVAMLNIAFVMITERCFIRKKLLTGNLLLICLCTFIMVASSAYRMMLYVSSYQLTFSRVLAFVGLAVIAAVMTGMVVHLFRKEFPIYRYCLIVSSIIYLTFSFSHVDYWIADYNLSHMTQENKGDILDYMMCLSTDAAPAIMEYVQENEMQDSLKEVAKNLYSEDDSVYLDNDVRWYADYLHSNQFALHDTSLRKWNLSGFLAGKQLIR